MVGMGTESDVEHAPGGERQRPAFAHPSEAEFASILDFYQLAWEYEPRTFPLRHAEDGRVVESFSPDFYLPELDLYIELTTLKQSLVTKKNRKLRRLRELYPDIRVKLFYGKDFRAAHGVLTASNEPAGADVERVRGVVGEYLVVCGEPARRVEHDP